MKESRFKNKEHSSKLRWLQKKDSIIDVDNFIAGGNQGSVFLALYLQKGQLEPKLAALKITAVERYKGEEGERGIKNAKRQIDIAQQIQQKRNQFKHIVGIYEVGIDPDLANNEDIEYRTYMVMEKADLDLEKFRDKAKSIRAELCYDTCLGIDELHSLNVAHRDLKPANVLVFKTLKPKEYYVGKLTDFGCTRLFTEKDVDEKREITTSIFVGSGGYKPPEANDPSKKSHNFRAHDVYSFSIIILEMLFGLKLDGELYTKAQEIYRNKGNLEEKDLKLQKPNLEGENQLLKLAIQGLRHNPEERPSDMKDFLKILSKYRGYQVKYRFENKEQKYSHLFEMVKDNRTIEDIKHPIIEEEEGSYVFDAVHWNNFEQSKCVLKILESKTLQQSKNLIRKFENYTKISTIYNDKLVQFVEKPFSFKKNQSCSYVYLLMEKELVNFQKSMLTYSTYNKLSICYHILKSIRLLHQNSFSIGRLTLKSIRLFQVRQSVLPKIVDFSDGIINPSPRNKQQDFESFFAFLYLVLPEYDPNPTANQHLQALFKTCQYNNIVKLEEFLKTYQNHLPNILEKNNSLQMLCQEYPELKRKIFESSEIEGSQYEFRVNFLAGDRPKKARIRIQDLAATSDVEQAKLKKQIKMIPYVKDSPGFLQIYQAKNGKRYSYIITEDYLCDCREINKLRKELLVTPHQMITDFTNMMLGLKYLHRKQITHMNIVPKSIFLLRQNNLSTLKLGNFGYSLTHEQDDFSVFQKFLHEDEDFKPPEYKNPYSPFEKAKRFTCDTWMFGQCCVRFLTGFKNFQKELDDFKKLNGANQIELKKAEEIFEFLIKKRRSFEDYWNQTEHHTIGRTIKQSFGNTQIAQKNLNNKLIFAQLLNYFYSWLSFLMINEQNQFKNCLDRGIRIMQDKGEDKLKMYERFLRSNSDEYFMYLGSTWLYLICYLENACLSECQKIIEVKFPDHKQKEQIQRMMNQVTNRYKANLSFMQKIDPRVINQTQNTTQRKLQLFKPHLKLLLIVTRYYITESRQAALTRNEIPHLKGLIIGYDIQNYIDDPDGDEGYPKLSFENLSRMKLAELNKEYLLRKDQN